MRVTLQTAQQNNLLPERHPAKDFFIADVFDNLPYKDDLASMEHPIFTLSKRKDLRDLNYTNGNIHISIKPNSDGLPTIFDKDILLYCGSLLMDQVNKGEIPPKTLRISSHDLLVATNRMTSGEGYRLLKKALDRLKGVSIKTNIKTNKREITRAFGLIESYEVIESTRVKKRMIRLEITLSDWFYNSLLGKEVLTVNRNYFRLGKALERRLYEIARKHCGQNSNWSIGIEKLKQKTGSTSSLPKFRYFLKEIERNAHLPDYRLRLENDLIHFEPNMNIVDMDKLPNINRATIEKGRRIVDEAGTGWCFDELHRQFSVQLLKGFQPEKVDGAFINFIKKKVATQP